MSPVIAINVRRVGLVIEAACMLGMLAASRRDALEQPLAFGVPIYRVFQGGLVFGFVLWLVGTLAYRRTRSRGDS